MLLLLLLLPLLTSAEDPDLSTVSFLLWTPTNPQEHQVVELTEDSVTSSNFDPANPTVILSHGGFLTPGP